MFRFVAGLFKGKAEGESGGVDAASPPLNPASTPALAAKVLGHEGCVKLTSNDALGASCALRRTSQATPDFATLAALTRGNAGRRPVVAHCALRRLVCFWRAARLRSGSVLFSTANGRGGGKMTEALHRLTQRRRYAACAAVTAAGADGAAPAAQRVKAEPVEGTLRTYETAFINKSVPELPTGFPTGPWATREDAKDAIAAFCRNPATAGGAHGVVWGQLRQGSAVRGQQSALLCHEHNHGCKVRYTLEQFVEGWSIYSQFGEHSGHALAQSVNEANVHRSMRDIPPELLQVAKDMVKSSIPVAAVDHFLRYMVEAKRQEPTWTYMDVYHATAAGTVMRALDATNFAELLRQREHEQGLFSRTGSDSYGCLDRAFFEMPGAREILAIQPDEVTIVFDTKARTTRAPCRPPRCVYLLR